MAHRADRLVGGALLAIASVLAFSLPPSTADPSSSHTSASVPSWEVKAPVTATSPKPAETSQAGAAKAAQQPKAAPPAAIPAAAPKSLALYRPNGALLLRTSEQIGSIHVGQTNGHWDPVDPKPYDRAVHWDASALPSSSSTGTTYVYGHACKHHVCPFTKLGLMTKPQLQQLAGGKIVVRTSRGTLIYTIDTIGALPKTGEHTLATVDTSSPGNRFRIVLCEYDGLVSSNNYYLEGVYTSGEGN